MCWFTHPAFLVFGALEFLLGASLLIFWRRATVRLRKEQQAVVDAFGPMVAIWFGASREAVAFAPASIILAGLLCVGAGAAIFGACLVI